jgi:hypothetical protein
MDNLFIIIFIFLIIGCLGRTSRSSGGGYVVKNNPASKKPKIGAAPQPLRNKQGRTKDEQELHEWMEDNPR